LTVRCKVIFIAGESLGGLLALGLACSPKELDCVSSRSLEFINRALQPLHFPDPDLPTSMP
jgi:hypothetical protein